MKRFAKKIKKLIRRIKNALEVDEDYIEEFEKEYKDQSPLDIVKLENKLLTRMVNENLKFAIDEELQKIFEQNYYSLPNHDEHRKKSRETKQQKFEKYRDYL